jgi:hypothetical protein
MIKNNQTLILVSFLMLLFGYTTFQFGKMYFNERREKKRIERPGLSASQMIVYYKASNGRLVAKNDVHQLKYNEMKGIYPEIIAEIRNLKITPNRTEHYSETVIHEQKDIVTTIRDSMIYDTIPVRCFITRQFLYC